jgi:hypothetical protein
MAINPVNAYPGRVTGADANYPYGSGLNDSVPGDNTGTPFDKQFGDDIWGFFQALLTDASIVPSGNPDTALVSQYLQAIYKLIDTIPVYIDNDDAITSGRPIGSRYRTPEGQLNTVVANVDARAAALLDPNDNLLASYQQRVMTGATAGDPGTAGVVPAPAAGDQLKYFSGGGTYENLPAAAAAPEYILIQGSVPDVAGQNDLGYIQSSTLVSTAGGTNNCWESVNDTSSATWANIFARVTNISPSFQFTEITLKNTDTGGSGSDEDWTKTTIVIDWVNEVVIGSVLAVFGGDNALMWQGKVKATRLQMEASSNQASFVKVGGFESLVATPLIEIDWTTRSVVKLPLTANTTPDHYFMAGVVENHN